MDPKYKDLLSTLSSSKDKNSRILIVDGLNMFIRVFSAVPSLDDNGNHVGGISGFLRALAKEIRQFSATRCIVVFDGKGGSYRRRKLFPDYKKNRKVRTSLNRYNEFKNIVDEQRSMQVQLARLFSYLTHLPLTVIAIDNIEADDTIAYLVRSVFTDDSSEIRIVSTDRDFLQLVDDRIQVLSPVKKILYTPKVLNESFPFHPNNYILYRSLTGDKSDNIPGIKGLGLKSLTKYLPTLKHEATLDQIIQYAKDHQGKYKIYDKIVDNIDQIRLNYKLMQLEDVDISGYAKGNIREIATERKVKLQTHQFLTLYNEDRLSTAISNIDQWLVDSFSTLSIYG